MNTLTTKLLIKPSLHELAMAVSALNATASDAILVLVDEHSGLELQPLVDTLRDTGVHFFGGLFPGVIYGQTTVIGGVVLAKIPVLIPPFMVQSAALEGMPAMDYATFPEGYGVIVFVDGLTRNIGEFLDNLNNVLGERFSFMGGGAGSLTLIPQPCLFTEEGVFQDTALCCLLNAKLNLGIRHGWQRLAGPLVVTKSEGNIIKQLNWQEAFKVYREIVEADCGLEIRPENFFDISKRYPFGMIREQDEDVVRDPITCSEKGELVCVGEVPSNSVLYILKGDKDQLLQASAQAYDDSGAATEANPHGISIVMDCISRNLFLEDRFGEELAPLQQEVNPAIGALTLGEISSYGLGALEFFNKTIVIGQVHPA